jgi:hypothetical protein
MSPISEQEEQAAIERARDLYEQRILSMTPDGKTSISITAVLRQRIEEIAQAIRDKNVDRLLAFYAPNVTAFDLRPPLDVRGAAAYRTRAMVCLVRVRSTSNSITCASWRERATLPLLALVSGARRAARLALGSRLPSAARAVAREPRHISMPA